MKNLTKLTALALTAAAGAAVCMLRRKEEA